jgi:endonuclease YncB( thermonuclease family)
VRRTGVVAVLMAASLTACTPTDTVTTTAAPAATNTVGQGATVTWIYDGDTIEVEGDDSAFDVRLIGINAPDQGECFHQRATDHLIDTLKGRQVRLEVVGQDRFDRQLAVVWHGERQACVTSRPVTGIASPRGR